LCPHRSTFASASGRSASGRAWLFLAARGMTGSAASAYGIRVRRVAGVMIRGVCDGVVDAGSRPGNLRLLRSESAVHPVRCMLCKTQIP